MLQNIKDLEGFAVGAIDGEFGTIKDFYFDDQHWTIRYIVVKAGGWLSGRKVLISPNALHSVTWADGVMHINLTQQQIKDSPDIDTDKPVSRQHEIDHFNYYGYPNYWSGANLWGPNLYPLPWINALPSDFSNDEITREIEWRAAGAGDTADAHLRSCNEVIGYEIGATDGVIGSVENFVFDDHDWAIRKMVVDSSNWLPGKAVLISPGQIERVSWSEQKVMVKVTRKTVEASPEYHRSAETA